MLHLAFHDTTWWQILLAIDHTNLQDHCGRPRIARRQLILGHTTGSRSRQRGSGKFRFELWKLCLLINKEPWPPSSSINSLNLDAPVEIPASPFSSTEPTSKYLFHFLTVPEPLSGINFPNMFPHDAPISEPRILENTFLAQSMGGFVISGKVRENPELFGFRSHMVAFCTWWHQCGRMVLIEIKFLTMNPKSSLRDYLSVAVECPKELTQHPHDLNDSISVTKPHCSTQWLSNLGGRRPSSQKMFMARTKRRWVRAFINQYTLQRVISVAQIVGATASWSGFA